MQTPQKVVNEKSPAAPEVIRKVYVKPRLEDLGDVRSLTLGGSPGPGESSGPGSRKR
jgi:hypothetical protein